MRPGGPGEAPAPSGVLSAAALDRLAARSGPMDRHRDGMDWPGFAHSRWVQAAGLDWHVQQLPAPAGAPRLLFLHGTGASLHSWRDLAPHLAGRAEWLALDLPGHGFSGRVHDPFRHRLDGMADGIATLLEQLAFRPDWLIGHSAGAAMGLRMVLERQVAARGVIAFNGALLPFGGRAGKLLLPLTRRLVTLPGVPAWLARKAGEPATFRRLLNDTGSRLDRAGEVLYGRLARAPGHVAAALAMMAHWDLNLLAPGLPGLDRPLHLVTSAGDRTVRPEGARQIAGRCAAAVLHAWPALGHLAHEEAPARAAELIARLAGLPDPMGGNPAHVNLD